VRRDLGVEAVGNRAGDALGSWPGGVVAAAGSLLAAVVAGIGGLANRNVPAAAGGGLLVVLGKVVELVQAVFLGIRGRSLTEDEQATLSVVFENGLDLRAIRVVPGFSGIFGANRRPFTLGGVIYLKGDDDPATLVHECVHVWQYQHLGSRYTVEALLAQKTVKPSAYRWVDELGRGCAHWREFNREAQAQLIEDMAKDGFFTSRMPVFFHSGADHTELAIDALAAVRCAERSV
jgi:hypothetical protein